MTKTNILTKCLLIFTIGFLLIGCTSRKEEVDGVLTLTAPKTAYSILTIIADKKGFFKESGIDVQVNYVKTGKLALDDLLGGNADMANIVETNIAFAGFQNVDFRVIATVEKVFDATVVARKNAGINTPEDLRGKRIGVLQSTTSQIYAHRLLEKHNISINDVTFVNLLPPAMQAGIIEGSGLDAISLWQPYIYNAENALEGNSVSFRDNEIFTGYMTLAVKDDVLENRDQIRSILRAYKMAEKFALEFPNEAKALVAEELQLDVNTMNTIWSQYELNVTLDNDLIEDTRREGTWILKNIEGYEDRNLPDYQKLFDKTFLNDIKE